MYFISKLISSSPTERSINNENDVYIMIVVPTVTYEAIDTNNKNKCNEHEKRKERIENIGIDLRGK